MIKRMISHDYSKRLDIEDILCHPLFWDSEKKVRYFEVGFLNVRDWVIELHSNQNHNQIAILSDHFLKLRLLHITVVCFLFRE